MGKGVFIFYKVIKAIKLYKKEQIKQILCWWISQIMLRFHHETHENLDFCGFILVYDK